MFRNPTAIVAGPDGALWFSEEDNNMIGRITTAGQLTEFPAPGNPSANIAAGADGALWFTERDAGRIGRITTAGHVTDFPIPNSGAGFPLALAAGPDGALWFVDQETGPSYIGRITTAGDVKPFPVRPASALGSIAAGPDGAVWFTNAGPAFTLGGETLGRITSAGVLTSIPAPEGVADSGGGLVTGPGALLSFGWRAALRSHWRRCASPSRRPRRGRARSRSA